MSTQAIIFDIDGTLADCSHRLHFIKGGKKDYDSFYAAVKDDKPIKPIIGLHHTLSLRRHATILFVSGRPEKTRADTINWLIGQGINVDSHRLFMRPDGDFRADDIIKEEILDYITGELDYQVELVIDDRPRVVAMWRRRGLTCLQCRDWDDDKPTWNKGKLTIMVGPSGAGKTRWCHNNAPLVDGLIVRSDSLRIELTGGVKDQTKNDQVFAAAHAIIKARIDHGLDCIFDATSIRRQDRLAAVALAGGGPVEYVVINRPMEDKVRDGGWRLDIPGLLERHERTFQSQLKDILAGDNLPNVTVTNLIEGWQET